MPRSRTRARIRAARLAAGIIEIDPERTPARMRAWWRAMWKKAAALEDYPKPGQAPRSRHERAQAIRMRLQHRVMSFLAEMAEQDAAAKRRAARRAVK
jgi:hypothetical protein